MRYAQLDEGQRAAQMVVLAPERSQGPNGELDPAVGARFLGELHGGRWVYAPDGNLGDSYHEGLGRLVRPKPFASWELAADGSWVPPVPRPDLSERWQWDESLKSWVDASGVMDNVTFTMRFSGAEQRRLRTSEDPQVKALMGMVRRSATVRPKHPQVVQGLQYLQANGYLDHAARAAEILGS